MGRLAVCAVAGGVLASDMSYAKDKIKLSEMQYIESVSSETGEIGRYLLSSEPDGDNPAFFSIYCDKEMAIVGVRGNESGEVSSIASEVEFSFESDAGTSIRKRYHTVTLDTMATFVVKDSEVKEIFQTLRNHSAATFQIIRKNEKLNEFTFSTIGAESTLDKMEQGCEKLSD